VLSAEEYRRRERDCLEIAGTFRAGQRRTILLHMAQVWQRLADKQKYVTIPPKCLRHRLPLKQPSSNSK